MSENSSNYILLGIVAIVAVVGLVVIFANSSSKVIPGYNIMEKDLSDYNLAGQAAKPKSRVHINDDESGRKLKFGTSKIVKTKAPTSVYTSRNASNNSSLPINATGNYSKRS